MTNVLSFIRSIVRWTIMKQRTTFNQIQHTEKPQLDTNVLADEIEKYLWKCFFFVQVLLKYESRTVLRCYVDFLSCFTFLPPMCSSCDPESVCRPVDVRFKLLFIFSFDEAFNKKIYKITPLFDSGWVFFFVTFMLFVERANQCYKWPIAVGAH